MATVDYAATLEYYNDPETLLAESDLVESDAHIVGWSKQFRIRALTFEQMDNINAKATNDKGEIDHKDWVYWTIVEGVIRPNFTYQQAKQLGAKNGVFVEALADEIWKLGRIGKNVFDSFINELKAARDAQKE